MWGPDQGNNPFGSGDQWEWKPTDRGAYTVPAANVNVGWTEFTIDMVNGVGSGDGNGPVSKAKAQDHVASFNPQKGHYHYRNICFSLGGEQGVNPYNPPTPIVYYFADVRLSKSL
jgi:hypothetical protein